AFRMALGRHLAWGFDPPPEAERIEVAGVEGARINRLRIRPHAFRGPNAYYDESRGEICFGYYEAPQEALGRTLPGETIFTALSHDVVVHEVTHALLDGLRA